MERGGEREREVTQTLHGERGGERETRERERLERERGYTDVTWREGRERERE